MTAPSAKEALWLTCREKRCCSHYSVNPTAADLWRVSRAFELPAHEFTRYADAAPDQPDAFALDETGPRFQLVLAKRDGTCMFLLRLPDGHAQCALGSGRPTVCRSFPATLDGDLVCLGDHAGCSCGLWSQAVVGADELGLLRQLDEDRREYADLVEGWNAMVARSGGRWTFPEFCDHVLNNYAERHAEA